MNKDFTFAVGLAREAGKIMKQNFSPGMKKEWKEDGTPLTITDTTINTLVMNAVQENYPTYSFIGEEGSRLKESEYTWVCDPIDGTMPFSYGWPTFAFSLALVKNGESMLGVVYDPICDRLLWAEKGSGAFLNGRKVSVSSNQVMDKTTFVETGDYAILPKLQETLAAEECRVPTFYSCVYAGILVATGEFAGQVYKHDKPWDGAALKVIVEEAGGRVTDLRGEEQRYDRKINGFIASNGAIHQRLVDIIRPMLK